MFKKVRGCHCLNLLQPSFENLSRNLDNVMLGAQIAECKSMDGIFSSEEF